MQLRKFFFYLLCFIQPIIVYFCIGKIKYAFVMLGVSFAVILLTGFFNLGMFVLLALYVVLVCDSFTRLQDYYQSKKVIA